MYINHKGSKLVWIDKKELRDIILNTYLEVKIDQNVPQKIKLVVFFKGAGFQPLPLYVLKYSLQPSAFL